MKQRGVIKPIMQSKKEEVTESKTTSLPQPPYAISTMTRHFLENELASNKIVEDDLNFIYDLGRRVAGFLNHERPLFYDLAAAVQMKSVEEVRDVAEGRKEILIVLPEFGTRKMQTHEFRVALWKRIAEAML